MHHNNGCVALETNNRANNIKIEKPYLFPNSQTEQTSFYAECLPKFIPDAVVPIIYCHLSDLTCRMHYCRPFIFLAERARASVEREMVIYTRSATNNKRGEH